MSKVIFDLETNGLLQDATLIWCGVAKDLDTGTVIIYDHRKPETLKPFLGLLKLADTLIGHNIIAFDLPILEKFKHYIYNQYDCEKQLIDTYILSRLLHTDRGGHSVKWWGNFFGGEQKIENDVWDKWDPIILERCESDIRIQEQIYNYLMYSAESKRLDQSWASAYKLECQVQRLITQQELHGWSFDKPKAEALIETLDAELDELKELIYTESKPVLKDLGEVTKVFKKDGNLTHQVQKYMTETTLSVGGPFTRIKFEPLNLSSDKQVKDFLLGLGWKPTEYNYKKDPNTKKELMIHGKKIPTSPKLTLDSFDSLQTDVGQSIAMYITREHRRNQLQGLLAKVRSDGKLTAECNTIGCNTHRMRHHVVVNIPKKGSYLGEAMRALFIASTGQVLVGCDAAALEARVFAHYLNDPLFTDNLLNGDIHTYNQENWDLETRQHAKNTMYALLYGAGSSKLGKVSGISGELLKEKFNIYWPTFPDMKINIDKAVKRGYLIGLDGRKLYFRSAHSALNTLIQGSAEIVMKRALVIFMKLCKDHNLEVDLVGNVHDEFIAECHPIGSKLISQFAERSIKEAGEYYNLRCPLKGEAKIGRNWNEIH